VNRTQKEELVATMRSTFEDSGAVVVTQYSGLTVEQITDLRTKMREVGAEFKVTKNRLTRLALEGTAYEGLSDTFTGPTAIAYANDPVGVAKVAVDYAKKNDKLVLIGGGMPGTVLDADGVKSLAAMPSLDESRAKLVGLLQAPASKIAAVLQAPAGQLARVFGAYSDKGEAA
jgi:large subunit ribosomal protein L10